MYNITLIGTIHNENGKCNADELYEILEDINPEMIFDELPRSAFDMFYSDSFEMYYTNSILRSRLPPVIPLEVKCIRKYKQSYDTKIFPVDIDVRQKLSKQDEIFMFHTFFEYDEYIKLDNENTALVAQEGFHYLNSDKFLDYLVKKEVLEKNIMESEIQKDRLLDIYELFHAEQCDDRENGMLQNIYNYSKGNQYNRAVFLIGAKHQKSIMQKITEYEKLSEIKLNWKMFGNK
jgi:hypothetical protein